MVAEINHAWKERERVEFRNGGGRRTERFWWHGVLKKREGEILVINWCDLRARRLLTLPSKSEFLHATFWISVFALSLLLLPTTHDSLIHGAKC